MISNWESIVQTNLYSTILFFTANLAREKVHLLLCIQTQYLWTFLPSTLHPPLIFFDSGFVLNTYIYSKLIWISPLEGNRDFVVWLKTPSPTVNVARKLFSAEPDTAYLLILWPSTLVQRVLKTHQQATLKHWLMLMFNHKYGHGHWGFGWSHKTFLMVHLILYIISPQQTHDKTFNIFFWNESSYGDLCKHPKQSWFLASILWRMCLLSLLFSASVR